MADFAGQREERQFRWDVKAHPQPACVKELLGALQQVVGEPVQRVVGRIHRPDDLVHTAGQFDGRLADPLDPALGGWDGVPFNAAWQKHFGGKQTVNLGIGGDRMENILWRLDHGALDGTSPKVIVLKIGVNNAPLVFANGAPAATAAHGIKLCIENLRMRCPKSQIVLVKILPAFDPTKEAGKAVVDINACLDVLKLDQDPQVHILDLWKDFTNADGTLKTELYSDKHLHLGDAGYEAFAARLKPVVDDLIN